MQSLILNKSLLPHYYSKAMNIIIILEHDCVIECYKLGNDGSWWLAQLGRVHLLHHSGVSTCEWGIWSYVCQVHALVGSHFCVSDLVSQSCHINTLQNFCQCSPRNRTSTTPPQPLPENHGIDFHWVLCSRCNVFLLISTITFKKEISKLFVFGVDFCWDVDNSFTGWECHQFHHSGCLI